MKFLGELFSTDTEQDISESRFKIRKKAVGL
jgi:hypothetical protein